MFLTYELLIILPICWTAVVAYNCTNGNYGSSCNPCGQCANGANCDKLSGRCELGCELGYQMPFCKSECVKGTYGNNCANPCGHCYNGAFCDMISGACPAGKCDTWYVGNSSLCNVFIDLINIHTIPRAVYVKSNWARLELDVFLDKRATQHYHFEANYIHEHQLDSNFMEYEDISSNYDPVSEKLTVTVHNLKDNTQYWFRIQIFREHNGLSEAGSPSKEVRVSTYPSPIPVSAENNGTLINCVIALIVFEVFSLLIISGIALWILYQCFRQKQGGSTSMKLRNDVSSNNFHQSHSEADTSRVAFRL